MSLGSYIIAGILLLIVGLIMFKFFCDRKKGKSIICDCSNCKSGCPMSKNK